ncbi:hypothetical protein EJ07DRAFT_184477 [Lizonia empirigonia]|nr:hypothetical protein EJ07DRAFT_184477 [Lizonia empirigonia]
MALARQALRADIDANFCSAPVEEAKSFNTGREPMNSRHLRPDRFFECTCVCDPNDTYGGIRDAIIKIKYQIKGHEGILNYYAQYLEQYQQALNNESRPEQRKRRLEDLEHAQELQYQATHALEIPHRHTTNEIIALRRLRKLDCASTPQFLDNAAYWLTPDIDDQCMEGGYMIALLMTRVPGKQISYDMFWNLKDKAARDEIREVFKITLLYILDFEDWDTVNVPDPEAWWNYHPRWRDWWLAEECGPSR